MQPFITPDGVFLLFNNRSDPREDTRLHIAERIDDLTFHYLGELAGINSAGLDAAASVDNTNTLYFVSARNFGKTDETIYQSHFDAGVVSRIEPVSGISEHIPGRISFDAAVSSDGNVLLLVDGRFGKSNLPTEAEISMAIRTETGFQRTSTSQRMLGSINAPNALNYAPVLSTDLKELFFTRLIPGGRNAEPVILRAYRESPVAAFGPPQRVASIDGYAEAPALSPDGHSLYFSKREKTSFTLFRVTR